MIANCLTDRGTRKIGFKVGDHYVVVPEMIPELVVPDLEGCKMKPYVSYRSTRVVQSEFTPQDLFNAVYADKIRSDFEAGKLDDNGNPLEPNELELLTPKEALDLASKTGSDLFMKDYVPEVPEEVK